MPRRLLIALVIMSVIAVGAPARPTAAAAAPATTPVPPNTVVDNEFIPDRDLDECISALPQPGCGSDARSGWRQWAIFGLLVVALAFIAWRIARGIRRGRPERMTPDDT